MYYLWLNEAQTGPYTLRQVQSMWNAGQITAMTLYWQEGKTDWEPLGDILAEVEPPRTTPAPLIAETVALPLHELVGDGKPSVPYSPGTPPVAATESEPEQTHWTGHPTWWKWGWWLLLTVVLILAAAGLFFFNLPLLIALSPLPAALLVLLYVYLDRRTTRYTVTSKRVSIESGLLVRKSHELRIQDIRSIAADMNFLGYGDIEFSSAASDDVDVAFIAVAGAAKVRDMVKKLQS